METTTKAQQAILIYTEQTPNPDSLKFVSNRMLFKGLADFRERTAADEWSPLASQLFDKEYVKGVYISNNFITITKESSIEWSELMITLKDFIKSYISEATHIIVKDGYAEWVEAQEAQKSGRTYEGKDAEIVTRIKELIEHYVKPAVEMDGGNIEFKAWDEGRVTVALQGSCSGCPSSTVTLKAGIEGMLKRMIPEVVEVVAEAE